MAHTILNIYLILFVTIHLLRFLHLHNQGKAESGGEKSHTDVRMHPLAKIDSQESRIGSRSGSEESHSETKTKNTTFVGFRKRYR
jgi:hypothetical protein